MSIEVRELSLNDQQSWQDLFSQYAHFYKLPMNKQILANVWSWIHCDNEQFYCIVACNKNQQIVGFMHYRAMFSSLRGCEVGFLDDLFVAENHRGSGAVEKLFAALNSRAQEHNWPIIRWITADDNHRAQAVYNKLSKRTHWVTYQLDVPINK